ncbi:hypothetical protein, partial [Nioella ostreopsis]|uniref:hypothetical protein n=1 Tax=Nioella ostreopsis TaxID=2448479 RepID=UPI00197F7988
MDEALERLPDDLPLKIRRGVILRQLSRLDESVALLRDFVAAHPQDLQAKHELAVSLRLIGEYTQSLALSDAILQINPLHRPSLMAQIDTNTHAQNFAAALS